jgi:hypothetical protein
MGAILEFFEVQAMTDQNKDLSASELASKGGKARAKALSPEERSKIAKKAVEARWEKAGKSGPPAKATHEGQIDINGIIIPCAVLEGGVRVISQRGMSKALGRVVTGSGSSKSDETKPKTGDAKLPTFLSANNLKPFIDLELAASLTVPVEYTPMHGGRTAYGFKAELVPKICEVWLKAKDANVLLPSQTPTAEVASILIRGLAHVGIAALVDEVTGYQDVRSRNALAEILEAFIAKELRPWVRTFPPEFYQEMFRLRNIPYNGTVKRPQYIGNLTNDLIYARLAPGVLAELRNKNPVNEKGRRKSKHHQWLTDYGHPELKAHLKVVVALMKPSETWDQFYKMLQKSLPKYQELPLLEWMEKNKADVGDVAADAESRTD